MTGIIRGMALRREKLLNRSHKVDKNADVGVLTLALHLSPADEAGIDVCPFATAGCRAACLGHSAGMMVFSTHKLARIRRTRWLFRDRHAFIAQVNCEIGAAVRRADREGLICGPRLNAASDLPWERMRGADGRTVLESWPELGFYDYTKNPHRAIAAATAIERAGADWPSNYRLCFSRSGENDADCLRILDAGGTVAVVFAHGRPGCRPGPHCSCSLPATWNGYRVIDGDRHDYRYADPPGVVVGLRAKGAACGPGDHGGFVVPPIAT